MLRPFLFAIAANTLLGMAAHAQQVQQSPPAPPPTALQLEQSRSAMLEAQLRYFVGLLQTQEAAAQQKDLDAKVLADWWASYVAGLK